MKGAASAGGQGGLDGSSLPQALNVLSGLRPVVFKGSDVLSRGVLLAADGAAGARGSTAAVCARAVHRSPRAW